MMDFLSQANFLQRYNRDGSSSSSELLKCDTVSAFLDARSQPPLSCAQRHLSWKYLPKCKYAGISMTCVHKSA